MERAECVEVRPVYEGRIVRLRIEKVRLPNGNVCELEIVRHPGAAAVVPLDRDGTVHLVRQYRHAAGGWVLEVPAGKLDGGESAEACAARELREEIGRQAGSLEPLGSILTTPGFTNERIWLFLARELSPAPQGLQPDEALRVERVPFEEAVRMALRGEIEDAKSVCALVRAGRLLSEGSLRTVSPYSP